MPDHTDKPIGTYRPDAIDIAVENLVTACGFSNSHQDSEEFFDLLIGAIDLLYASPKPHDTEGLPFDMTHSLANALRELAQDRGTSN